MKKASLLVVTLLLFFEIAIADEAYKSTFQNDVDGDNRVDTFSYKLQKHEKNYSGELSIISADGNVLWEHKWEMNSNDLEDDLLQNEGNITLKKWVEDFFSGKLLYGAIFEKTKLRPIDLQNNWIDFYADRLGIRSTQLKQEILSQEKNSVFIYRASWRENLIKLVYIPEYNRFIGFSGGEY